MREVILKLHRDRDEYVLWDRTIDSPVSTVGDRKSVAKLLRVEYENTIKAAEQRLDRAERTGTSMWSSRWGGWGAGGFRVREAFYGQEGPRWLPRANLRAFCYADDDEDMETMLAVTELVDGAEELSW